MNYTLLPSLEQAAAVRIASLLYNDCEIEHMSNTILHYGEQVEMKIDEKLSSLLRPPLRKRVVKVILPMHILVTRWKRDHVDWKRPGCCCAYLCWKTDGTINRIETSKRIVADENLYLTYRFVMACTYFLEDEVIALWEKCQDIENLIDKDLTNVAVRFWIEWLKKKETEHWTDMIDGYFRTPRWLPGDIPVRASCFYHLLSRESKQNIDIFDVMIAHNFDFLKCVTRMDETERIEALRSNPVTALKSCFRWPYLSLFIRIANAVIGHLTLRQFLSVLQNMMITLSPVDEDDILALETFWQISPSVFTDEAKRNEFIIELRNKFLEDRKVPRHLKRKIQKIFG